MPGITVDIDPVIFHVGGFGLRWYGLAFAGGIALAAYLSQREAKRAGLDTAKVSNVAFWAVLGGLIGARLFHVVDRFDYYVDNLTQALMITQGGLAIWGGLLTGGLVALFVARREGLPGWKLADATAIGLVAGQMVGRVGCLINGDSYGAATGLPWGLVYVNPGAMVPDDLRGVPTHPYPAYEILLNAVLLAALLYLRRRPLKEGALFLTYVSVYALVRLLLTIVRQESAVISGLQQAQVVSLVALAAAAVGWAYVLSRRPLPGSVGNRPS